MEGGRGGGGGCRGWGGLLKCSLDSFSGLSLGFFLLARSRTQSLFFSFQRVASALLRQHVRAGTQAQSHMPPSAPSLFRSPFSSGLISVKNNKQAIAVPTNAVSMERRHVLIIAVNTSPSSVAPPRPLPPTLRPPGGLKPQRGLLFGPSSLPLSWLILPALYLIAIRRTADAERASSGRGGSEGPCVCFSVCCFFNPAAV